MIFSLERSISRSGHITNYRVRFYANLFYAKWTNQWAVRSRSHQVFKIWVTCWVTNPVKTFSGIMAFFSGPLKTETIFSGHWKNTSDLPLKGSSDPSQFISEINDGKSRIRHTTTLKLNDEFLDRLQSDCHSNSESFYVRSASFRHWFQK